MKKFARAIFAVVAIVLAIASFSACGDKEGSKSDVFKIGGIGPLTGTTASYGISVQNGAQIAVDEINEAGGVKGMKLELIFEDDENDEEKAVSAYNKLMDEGMQALVGAVTSNPCIAVAEESKKDGILQITPSGSAKDCTKYSNGFRICFTDPLQGETMAKYINEQGIKKVAVIFENSSDYSVGITNAFVTTAEGLGMEVVVKESFSSGDIDFKTQLTKIKSSGAECIFLPIYYTEAAYIAQQAVQAGVTLPYFGCDGWDGIIDQLKGDTSSVEKAVFLTPFVATSEKENVKNFVAAYQKKYNVTPDQFAADGYDAIYAIKDAIEAADNTSNEALVAAMTKITVNGLTGDMTFNEDGEPNKSAVVATIENGAYIAK